jgi:predicted AAA+ superfamily ATPase
MVSGIEWFFIYIIVMVLIFVGFGRKQRFERVTKNLKVTRAFSTIVEELKAIGQGESHCTEVMVPVALSERSPVLLLMGGGMGAGKSTVTKDILKEYAFIKFYLVNIKNNFHDFSIICII